MVVRYGEGTPAIRTGTHMVTEPELLDDLKWFGFNLLSCANSHSLNFGEEGLRMQNNYLTPPASPMQAPARICAKPQSRLSRHSQWPNRFDRRHRPSPIGAKSRDKSTHRLSRQTRVNPLGFETTFVVDRQSFPALHGLGASRVLTANASGSSTMASIPTGEIGAATQTEYKYRGDRYCWASPSTFAPPATKTTWRNLRQIREARRQADWVIVSLHSQDLIGRSWLTAKKRTEVTEQPDFVHDFAHRCIDAGADLFACHGPHLLMASSFTAASRSSIAWAI